MESARILITEDDPGTRTVMKIVLQTEGHLVAEAANGAEALNILCDEDPPNLVLLDLSMPGINGFEFLEALSAMQPRPASKVVVVTADRTPGLANDLADLGAAGFLHKPLRRGDLKRLVETVFSPAAVGKSRTASHVSEPIAAPQASSQDDHVNN